MTPPEACNDCYKNPINMRLTTISSGMVVVSARYEKVAIAKGKGDRHAYEDARSDNDDKEQEQAGTAHVRQQRLR